VSDVLGDSIHHRDADEIIFFIVGPVTEAQWAICLSTVEKCSDPWKICINRMNA
jgi:hypothetical protein